jgi:serine protease Do
MRRAVTVGFIGVLAFAGSWLATNTAGADEQKDIRKLVVVGTEGGHLGVRLDEIDASVVDRLKLPEERGALVLKVESGSPADKAGLQKDDVIVSLQGQKVESASQFARMVRETPVGRTVAIDIIRKGTPQRVAAVLGQEQGLFESGNFDVPVPDLNLQMPDMRLQMPHGHFFAPMPEEGEGSWHMAAPGGPRKLGITFQPISGQLAQYFRLDADHGLLVTSVDEDGPAAKAGVKAGDVVLKLGGRKIASAADLHEALEDVAPGNTVPTTVFRDGKPVDLKIVAGGSRAAKSGKPAKDRESDDETKIEIKKEVKKHKSI